MPSAGRDGEIARPVELPEADTRRQSVMRCDEHPNLLGFPTIPPAEKLRVLPLNDKPQNADNLAR